MVDGYTWDDKWIMFNALTRACKLKNDVVFDRKPVRKKLIIQLLYAIKQKRFHDDELNQFYIQIMYISAFQTAYYGLMRVGEYTRGPHVLKAKDVSLSQDKSMAKLILHSSKTHDRSNRPQNILIKLDQHDIEEQKKYKYKFHPVKQLDTYSKFRGSYINDDDQFYIFMDGTPLLPDHIRSLLRELIGNLGLNPESYDTHSFRIGRATDLMKRGDDLETVKRMGRWKSNAVYNYLRD